MIDDKNCLRQLRKHNQEALEYVVRQYGGAVKNVITKALYNFPQEVQECMDDVFLEVWNNIDRYDERKGSLKNWILAIARYRAINYLKRLSKRYVEENLEMADNMMEFAVYIDEMDDLSSSLLDELLEGLSDIDKKIITKRYIEDAEISDIAKECKLKESTIYSRISRSKSKIRKNLGRNEV